MTVAMQTPVDVHVYPTTIQFESRILKVTRTLTERGVVPRVIVVGLHGRGLPETEMIDGRRSVVRIPTLLRGNGTLAKSFRFLEWSVRVFLHLRRQQVMMVNCHSLSVLPLCVALKMWHRVSLVYEPHELETETVTATGVRKRVARWLELALIGQADLVITVSDSIAEAYRTTYDLPAAYAILNVPERSDTRRAAAVSFREKFGIPDDHLVFLYQGAFEEGRGVRVLLDAFHDVSADRHLVLMGFGSMSDEIAAVSARTPNVHLHPPVPPDRIAMHTAGADVGIALLSDTCLNHRFALPNKLFEYLQAGLPVIVSDLPEMGAIVTRYGCGWRVRNAPRSIAECVRAVDWGDLERRRAGAERAAAELHWGVEADKLAAIYTRTAALPELTVAPAPDRSATV